MEDGAEVQLVIEPNNHREPIGMESHAVDIFGELFDNFQRVLQVIP
jgi:hypothetical protein